MVTAALNPHADIVTLTADLVNIASVSGDENLIAASIFSALSECGWLEVHRFQNCVIAKTNFKKPSRVIVAGHIDTVPVADNANAKLVAAGEPLPSDGSIMTEEVLFGLGSCDMKGGVAVALRAAASIQDPQFDVTYIFMNVKKLKVPEMA